MSAPVFGFQGASISIAPLLPLHCSLMVRCHRINKAQVISIGWPKIHHHGAPIAVVHGAHAAMIHALHCSGILSSRAGGLCLALRRCEAGAEDAARSIIYQRQHQKACFH